MDGRTRRALHDAVAVVPHTDADGLAAGAIALRARGEGAGAAMLLGRGQTAFADDAPLPDGLLARAVPRPLTGRRSESG